MAAAESCNGNDQSEAAAARVTNIGALYEGPGNARCEGFGLHGYVISPLLFGC